MNSQIPEDVVASWDELLQRGEGRQRLLGLGHPLKIHFGDGDAGEPIFFVRSRVRPRKPDISAAVRVDLGLRKDGEWAMTFALTDIRFKKTFMSLCWDLAERSKDAASEAEGLARFATALGEWKKLMTFHDSDTLSEAQVRGLIAEMWFGFVSGHLHAPVEQIQEAWQGPLGSDQDYKFLDAIYEIKSVHADSTKVRISSAEQLDAAPLDLVLVTLTETPVKTAASWTLRDLITHVEDLHAGDLSSLERLTYKLEQKLRVDKGNPYYAEHHYLPVGYRVFAVSPDFPAVRSSGIPTDVVDVSYSLKIPALNKFLSFSAKSEESAFVPDPGVVSP
ncbi:Putative PD-(D/E)XK family member [Arthrobacter sp. 49Tsu3.1M3]|uniref:PD-(D/E)XK motif protein n=1 Tax=Arthrobacter sp. 49Tsu3.1M3 TaxID=1279029 RepID=UPI0009A58A4C|nr:PD-(D/E)XK motif protein [Arthrobacter sp. 49Tsu3.1M3]SKB73552.1 Putative PD-(D/E)XK family member [Arthrobacter sp. 49Tsu3.1M3]